MVKHPSHRSRSQNGHPTTEWTRPLLGTLVSIGVSGVPTVEAEGLLGQGFAAIERVQQLMSFHSGTGDIAAINAAEVGVRVRVDPVTYEVLRVAADVSAASVGVFDITVAPLAVASGRLPRPMGPTPDPAARWSDLLLEPPDGVTLRRPLWVDVGGIAKGHAVDLAMRALRLPPGTNARVNAGGDLRVAGHELQKIVLRVPGHPAAEQPILELREGSVASSAADDGPVTHFDGRRTANAPRVPSSGLAFVSVVAPSCVLADALTKVVLALGTDAAKMLAAFGASAYLYAPDRGWRVIGGESR